MRTALALALLLLPLAGCVGDVPDADGPRLAEPTTATVEVPRERANSTVPDPTRPDHADPGFVFTTPWRAGDAWDWESETQWRSLRVVEEATVNGRALLRVAQANGTLRGGPVTKVEWWVDAKTYAKLNQTSVQGSRNATFQPAAEGLRAFRNASLAYEENGAPRNASVRTNVWYKGMGRTQATWGTTETGHVESWTVRTGHEAARVHLVRHVSRLVGNDVAYEENDVPWRIVAYRFAGDARGVLRSV